MADTNRTINPENVSTGGPVEGACCFTSFAEGVELPTDASTALAVEGGSFENLGELSDQGWTTATSTTINKFKGYHGGTLLSEVADEEVTVKVEFVEIVRATVLKIRFGVANVEVEQDGFVRKITPTTVPGVVLPLVFDSLLSNGVVERVVFPRAKIESVDDEAHVKGGLRVYGMTFSALVDDAGHARYIYYARLSELDADDDDEETGGDDNGGDDNGGSDNTNTETNQTTNP